MSEIAFDAASAHRHFSADAFNRTWALLDKPDRSAEDDEQMLLCAAASLWHWTQRDDATAENLSVGYWLVSRVHAVAGCAEESARYARLALTEAEKPDVGPFYLAYAYEALARAEAAAGRRKPAIDNLAKARRVAETVPDASSRQMLLDDLATIPIATGC
ncbi:MAG: hypothetical protein AB1778_00150 [Candidatus Bipolaricaulota bacterium]